MLPLDSASRNGLALGAPTGLRVTQWSRCWCSYWIAHRAVKSLLVLPLDCVSHNEITAGTPAGKRVAQWTRCWSSGWIARLTMRMGSLLWIVHRALHAVRCPVVRLSPHCVPSDPHGLADERRRGRGWLFVGTLRSASGAGRVAFAGSPT